MEISGARNYQCHPTAAPQVEEHSEAARCQVLAVLREHEEGYRAVLHRPEKRRGL